MKFEDDVSLNRVLLHEFTFSEVKINSDIYANYISSRLNKLISLGACGFGIIDNGGLEELIKKLNPVLQRRINLIDKKICHERMCVFFEPMCDECNIRIENTGNIIFKGEANEDLNSALSSAIFNFYKFLLGIEYKLQIDINFSHFKKSIDYLHNKFKNNSKMDELNLRISSLKSILDSYRTINLSRLIFKPQAKTKQIELFEELVKEAVYRDISMCSKGLGYFSIAANKLEKLINKISILVGQSDFREHIEKTKLALCINLVLAKVDVEYNILNIDKYLPPIVNLK